MYTCMYVCLYYMPQRLPWQSFVHLLFSWNNSLYKKVLTLVNNLCMYWWHICTHYTYIYLWTICLFLCSNWQFWLNEMSVVPRHSLLLFHLIHVVFVAVVGTFVVRFFFFFLRELWNRWLFVALVTPHKYFVCFLGNLKYYKKKSPKMMSFCGLISLLEMTGNAKF